MHESSIIDPVLCGDFAQFMSTLKKTRSIDDQIIYRLNTTIPTQSFSKGVDIGKECKSLANLIQQTQVVRNNAIKKCVEFQLNKTKKLLEQREKDPEDYLIKKALNREQATLRLFQQEQTVEIILKERVESAFNDRCRDYYRANFPS